MIWQIRIATMSDDKSLPDDFDNVLAALDDLVIETLTEDRYIRYDSIEDLLIARGKDFKLPIQFG